MVPIFSSEAEVSADEWYEEASNEDIKEMIDLIKGSDLMFTTDDFPIDFIDELVILLKNSKFTNESAKSRLIDYLKSVYGFVRGEE